ncbi:MAG: helix-turn-helix domain-containing protein [Pseudomonadota bacterium]
MSSYLVAKVLRTRSTKNAERLALIVMADAADESGYLSLPVDDIAARCNVSRTTIKRAIAALTTQGLVEEDDNEALRVVLDGEELFAVTDVAFAEPEPEPEQTYEHVAYGPHPKTGRLGVLDAVGDAVEDLRDQGAQAITNMDFQRQFVENEAPESTLLTDLATGFKKVVPVSPKPEPPTDVRPAKPLADIIAEAADAEIRRTQPLYFHRSAHKADIDVVAVALGIPVNDIATMVRDYGIRKPEMKRITDLLPDLKRLVR